jgi:hypothetical protein
MKFIELSHTIVNGMVTYPGDPPVIIDDYMSMETAARKFGEKAAALPRGRIAEVNVEEIDGKRRPERAAVLLHGKIGESAMADGQRLELEFLARENVNLAQEPLRRRDRDRRAQEVGETAVAHARVGAGGEREKSRK